MHVQRQQETFWYRTARVAMPVFHHLTDDPNFKLNPDFKPETFYEEGGDNPKPEGGLYVTSPSQVNRWREDYEWDRPYTAEIDVPDHVLNTPEVKGRTVYAPMDDDPVEAFVPAKYFDQLQVKRVRPTARVVMPYHRNNNGVRQYAQPDDFEQNIEPWGHYMSSDEGDQHMEQLPKGWERGTTSFENPLYLPHEYGSWKQNLSQQHGGLTGKDLSQALLSKGHDGIITHDKYGIGEMVDLRPKGQRGHEIAASIGEPVPFPDKGRDLPSVGPHPDNFWGGGGCGQMALAFHSMWPDLKIGADIDNKDGTVNHAWVHDGQRAHDFMGTHDTPDGPAGMWPNATTHMDMDPAHLAQIFGREGIRWSPGDPWEDHTVHEAGNEIAKHWLGDHQDEDGEDW